MSSLQSDKEEKKTQQSNQFVTGLVIGLLAGSTSYFFLNTDQGQKLKKSFKEKLIDLKEEGLDLDQVKIGNLNLKQVAEILLNGQLKKTGSSKPKKKIIRKIRKRQTQPEQKNPKKFKGVL